MSRFPDARPDRRHVALVVRTELRRSWRTLRSTDRGNGFLILGAIGIPLYALGLGVGAFFLGGALAGGGSGPTALLRGVAVGAPLVVTFTVLNRTAQHGTTPDAAEGLLVVAAVPDLLAGLVLAEVGRVGAVAALPLLAVAVGLGAGTTSPLAALAVVAWGAILLAVGVALGYALGLTAALLAGRSPTVARHRDAIAIVLSLAVPVLYFAWLSLDAAERLAVRIVTGTPLAWVGDVVLATTPGADVAPVGVAGGVAVVGFAVPALWATGLALARRVWFMDPVQPTHEHSHAATGPLGRVLRTVLPDRQRVVVEKHWTRARRAPFTVQYAVTPLFVLLVLIQPILEAGRVPGYAPVVAALAGANAGGAAFALNPIGNERELLPVTLTSGVSGADVVAGVAVAGAVPGAALGLGLAVPLAVLAGVSTATLAGVVAVGLLAAAGAPAIASGWGVLFPRFEPNTVRGREVLPPSSFAFLGYAALFVAAVAPAAVLVPWLRRVVEPVAGLAGPGLVAAGVATTALLLTVFGWPSVRYAAGRFGEYRLD